MCDGIQARRWEWGKLLFVGKVMQRVIRRSVDGLEKRPQSKQHISLLMLAAVCLKEREKVRMLNQYIMQIGEAV